MTDKEREKYGLADYSSLLTEEKEKRFGKLLCKELRKSLKKKGFEVEKDELFYNKREGYDSFRYTMEYALNGYAESYEITENLRKEWEENSASALNTAKSDNEKFKSFYKLVKKHLEAEGRFAELEEEVEK